MWVVKYHCGISIPGDTQSSAGPDCTTPRGWPSFAWGAQDIQMFLRTGKIWCLGLVWDVIMWYSHRPPPQKPLQHPLSFSWNATTIRVTAFIYLRDRLASCQRCTQNYCYYIIWGEWGLKLIYLDLSEPAKEFKLFTYTHKNPVHWKLQGAAEFSLKTDMEID